MPEAQRDIVLVVDDSPDTLSFLTEAIERSGATVLVAVGGDLALDLVEEITPDIILLDAVMPGMDGFETCRRLKAKGRLAHVPVIFMTGLSETEHIVKGLEAGGIDYVTKPIAPDEILARIRVHLANARSAQSARAALDTAGRTLFAVDAAGSVLWCTPQAAQVLAALGSSEPLALPPSGREWLQRCLSGHGTAPLALTDGQGRAHSLSFIGRTGPEILLRLSGDPTAAGLERLRERLPITGREAEVLLWLSRGKSSRDIGEILGLSPRTVTKHLEGIYAKLGVENRTAASAVAARHLRDLD
ncbi:MULTISPECIES: response regulator transcription factor [Methylorubrum]|jgi:DNA-binding response OmpR family regulator/DNA-binding CsgD family transcriptional regulator|uniref:Two-component transcriptional response regulator LuxR family n=3 Tax=Methylorubrum TaxID=2282523 RepID=A0A177I360_9HYPH|nr:MULTISPECIES: response regulator transcription factor [Methylorubrum]ACB81723.1 two component transcriptional regulator, LuxR family [Methylorubrum populi BJ001]KAB7783552.1 Two-component transcriptional response regulator LuxR family [Methylorubrum populi]MBA8914303.1 DNA-binding response OmpR family regulator/DNA-binding CsgD family transcriptional regulator [Methylorubrum thiocyanatum]OAH22630.1 LuxR family transcriptional regulator [Methylorubrum populi]PZP67726.1 MAG: DNA-binding respo